MTAKFFYWAGIFDSLAWVPYSNDTELKELLIYTGTVHTFKRKLPRLCPIFPLQPCESLPLYYTFRMLFFNPSFQSTKIINSQRLHQSNYPNSSKPSMLLLDNTFSHQPFTSSLIQMYSKSSSFSLKPLTTASITARPHFTARRALTRHSVIIPPLLWHWLLLPLSMLFSLKP